jgi:hypothetical protein
MTGTLAGLLTCGAVTLLGVAYHGRAARRTPEAA